MINFKGYMYFFCDYYRQYCNGELDICVSNEDCIFVLFFCGFVYVYFNFLFDQKVFYGYSVYDVEMFQL